MATLFEAGRDYGEEDRTPTLNGNCKPRVKHAKVNGHGDAGYDDSEDEVVEELTLVPERIRNAVSRRDDETDQWGADELEAREEYNLILRDQGLKDTLMGRLNTFRRNRELCDVVFFVNEREILAHKLVLASISPALFDMFVSEADSSGKDSTKSTPPPAAVPTIVSGTSTKQLAYYEFPQADYDSFEALVNYAYTSKLSISSRRVADLYKTSFALQVTPIAKACARHLAEHLSFNNCIGIRKQANFNNDRFLVDKVDSFISENIERVLSDSVEFTQLPCIKVRIIAPNEVLRDDRAAELSEKLLQYFRRCPKVSERVDQHIDALTEKPHLLHLEQDIDDLQDCADMDDRSSVGSCDVVQDYKRSGQSKSSKTAGHNSHSIGVAPVQHHVTGATAVKINACLLSNAKYASTESLNSLASSATDTDEEIEFKIIATTPNSPGFWITVAVMFRRLVVFSIQVTENAEILRMNRKCASSSGSESESVPADRNGTAVDSNGIHGSSKRSSLDSGFVNGADSAMVADLPHSSQLAKLPSSGFPRIPLPQMEVARCSIGAAFINGKIIICGGYDRGECLKSVEEYDVIKGEWHKLPDMLCERGRFDAAVVGGKLFAVAGSNGNNDLRTAECFDPKELKWTPTKSLNKTRSHNGCAALGDLIYCIGGSSDQNVLRDCERYDPATDEWGRIAPLNTPRFQAACTTWRGLVVCCAGCDRWNCLDTVEAYDPKTDTWRVLDKLKTPRRGCAVAVIRDSLYVIGGHDGTQSLSSVEVLDHPNGHWRQGPPLITPRANTHAVVTAGNVAYVIGGFNGNQFLSSIEILENESVGWRNWQQIGNKQGAAIPEDDEDETTEPPGSESPTPRAGTDTEAPDENSITTTAP